MCYVWHIRPSFDKFPVLAILSILLLYAVSDTGYPFHLQDIFIKLLPSYLFSFQFFVFCIITKIRKGQMGSFKS